jgi:SulP family sulfate permease
MGGCAMIGQSLINISNGARARKYVDEQGIKHYDMSAIEALSRLTERYHKLGKTVHLKHLSQDCRQLFNNASGIIDVNVMEDPTYKVMTNRL